MYRAKEAISTDVNPMADGEFKGRLLKDGDPAASFIIVGKDGVLSDEKAEKFGLVGSDLVEHLEDGQLARESEEKNAATYNKVGSALTLGATPALSTPSPAPTSSEPSPVNADNGEGSNVIEVSNPVATDTTATDAGTTDSADESATDTATAGTRRGRPNNA